MSLPESVQALTGVGFTELEAEVYTVLQRESPATGYRLAQAIGKPTANTYKALETLQTKGAVIVEDGASRVYRATPVEELLAQLERSFVERKARARRALADLGEPAGDDRVYALRSREQVLERVRVMLARSQRIVLLDLFPEPIAELRGEIERTVDRGVTVAIKAYEPARVTGAHIVIPPRAETVRARWPGEWLNLVVDAREHLLAFLASDGRGVHQAIWSGSVYLSVLYYSGLINEIMMAALQPRIETGDSIEEVAATLARYTDLLVVGPPGYHALMDRFGVQPSAARRADGGPS